MTTQQEIRNHAGIGILVVFLLFSASARLSAQTSVYRVFSKNQDFTGHLEVNRTVTDSLTKISVISDCKLQVLFSISIKYTLTTVYHHNEFFFNSIVMYKDDEVNSTISTTRNGDKYRFVKDGAEKTYAKKIYFSEALLYFTEPVGMLSLYSEFDGVDKTIKQSEPGRYQITNPLNGNVSEYYYENGILSGAMVHHTLMPIYVVRE